MKLDTKQQVLVAIYTEYQKDLPKMEKITSEFLGLDQQVYEVAIKKLINEGYITDVIYMIGVESKCIYEAMLTRDGINYVEEKLEIESNLSAEEKIERTGKKLGEWGMTQFKDVVSKIAAELIKGSV